MHWHQLLYLLRSVEGAGMAEWECGSCRRERGPALVQPVQADAAGVRSSVAGVRSSLSGCRTFSVEDLQPRV